MDKVFVFGSFSRLLACIAEGLVTDDQLSTGLFVFGCKRVHAVTPEIGEVDEQTWIRAPLDGFAAHKVLVRAVLYAEDCGRCTWWRDATPEQDAGEALAGLLRERGLEPGDCDWTHGGSVGWLVEEFVQEEADRLLGIKSLWEEAVELDRLRQFGGG